MNIPLTQALYDEIRAALSEKASRLGHEKHIVEWARECVSQAWKRAEDAERAAEKGEAND